MAAYFKDSKSKDSHQVFENIRYSILKIFNDLIIDVIKRKNELLDQINQIELEFKEKTRTQQRTAKELKEFRKKVEEMSIKENLAGETQKASLSEINKDIAGLATITAPNLTFEFSLIEVRKSIKQIGTINTISYEKYKTKDPSVEIDYARKLKAHKVLGKAGSNPGQFKEPRRLHTDKIKRILYVCDGDNKIIQMFSYEGEFICQFGAEYLAFPSGAANNETYCYVTDSDQNAILQFQLSNLQFIRKEFSTISPTKDKQEAIPFRSPTGINVSHENELYIADTGNHRVCILSEHLSFRREIGAHQLIRPCSIQFKDNIVYILDRNPDNCLHLFNSKGQILKSMIPRGAGKVIKEPKSFCLDPNANVIIADYSSHTVKVFSPKGELMHRIGREASGTERLDECVGVDFAEQMLIVSCGRPLHCIKFI